MKNIFCKLFGHKFYFTTFTKTGEEYLSMIGMTIDKGITYRHETTYCTRCGLDRNKINKETIKYDKVS